MKNSEFMVSIEVKSVWYALPKLSEALKLFRWNGNKAAFD